MDTLIHKTIVSDTLPNAVILSGAKQSEGSLVKGSDSPEAILRSAQNDGVNNNARRRWLKMATSDLDRAGDILVIEGMDATNFLKNPQFLWQHGASGSLVNTIGKVLELKVVRAAVGAHHALFALVEYAPENANPLAEQVYKMDVLGLLPANSIGFRPIEYEANDFGGHTFTKWELVECSKVELPMNPNAVDRSVDSGERIVDSDKLVSLSFDTVTDWLLQ